VLSGREEEEGLEDVEGRDVEVEKLGDLELSQRYGPNPNVFTCLGSVLGA
jgi:hypothetical protein